MRWIVGQPIVCADVDHDPAEVDDGFRHPTSAHDVRLTLDDTNGILAGHHPAYVPFRR